MPSTVLGLARRYGEAQGILSLHQDYTVSVFIWPFLTKCAQVVHCTALFLLAQSPPLDLSSVESGLELQARDRRRSMG